MKTPTWPLLAALLAAGCGPSEQPPVQLMVMQLSDKGVYEPHRAALATMTDVSACSGTVATLLGGGRIIVDPNDPIFAANQALTDEQLKDALVKSKGIPPRGSYVENNGVLWPADFHTWNMVTTYYNFEVAFTYWQQTGVTAQEMGASTVYYFPYYADLSSGSAVVEQDNALFFSPIQAFMVLPFQQLQTVPLPMNLGVIAHEYSHRVFNKRVYGGESFPQPFTKLGQGGLVSEPQLNLLKSIDEGFADWNGFGATCLTAYGCNTRFLAASLSTDETDARDMAKNDKCVTTELLNQYAKDDANTWSSAGLQYRLGTVWASALYHAAEKTGNRQVLETALLKAYADTTPATPGIHEIVYANLSSPENITMAKVANSILQHITEPTLKTEMCNEFMDRLKINKADMPDCPPSAVGGTNCPAVTQP